MSPDDLVQCVDDSSSANGLSWGLVKGQLYWVTETADGEDTRTGAETLGVRVRSLASGRYIPSTTEPGWMRADRFRPFGGIKQTETDQGEISRVALETWRELHPEIAGYWRELTASSKLLG